MAKQMDKSVLKVATDAELLSYIINQDPVLKENIDLPVQGESILPIGKIIVNNQRYRNAFINVVNLIGLTIIKRNGWKSNWDFTKRGTLSFGQQIREIITDLCNVYDYNSEDNNSSRFLQSVVPNVMQYLHEINFQKFYETSVSDQQIAMAFEREGNLFEFINNVVGMLWESLEYDTYIVNKYMLCRRILDGTVTPYNIENFDTKSTREVVSELKGVSNKMSFRSPNYNPAGLRKATDFDDQIFILNSEFDGKLTTEVLATSFFRNDAELKARLALIDSFSDQDTARLKEVLGEQYVEFTSTELSSLKNISGVIISREWFMDYDYLLDNGVGEKYTEFYNPTKLLKNMFLHAWKVFSTSPFENACVFVNNVEPSVTSVTVSPKTASVSRGQKVEINLSATVVTTGFANKSVLWEVTTGEGVTVSQNGIVTIPANYSGAGTVTVTATSIFDNTKKDTATITVA